MMRLLRQPDDDGSGGGVVAAPVAANSQIEIAIVFAESPALQGAQKAVVIGECVYVAGSPVALQVSRGCTGQQLAGADPSGEL